MAESYFKAADPQHLKLLPLKLREASELEEVAAEVEAMVIDHFTAPAPPVTFTSREMDQRQATQIGDNLYVYLRGYRQDAADAAVDPNLKVALRRAVVNVLRWRLAQQRVDPLVASESSADGSKTVTYRDSAAWAFPEGWDEPLRAFDTREPAWGF